MAGVAINPVEGGALSLRPSDAREPVLDGVRGLAILLVLFCHTATVLKPVNALEHAYSALAAYGRFGVDLFFVLSGYLITGTLLRSRSRLHYFRNFYMRRFLRIFPLYYGALALFFLVLPRLPLPKTGVFDADPSAQKWYWLYVVNFRIALVGSALPALGHIWSLCVEEQFYLVWPAVVRLLNPSRLVTLCLFVLCACFGLRCLAYLTDVPHLGNLLIFCLRLDGLSLGAWLTIIAYRRAEEGGPLAHGHRWTAGWGLAISGLALAVVISSGLGLAVIVSMCVFWACLLQYLTTSHSTDISHRIFRNPLLTSFGKYSYSIYIFHSPLRSFVKRLMFGATKEPPLLWGSHLPATIAYALVVTALSYAIGVMTWNFFEKYFLKLKKYFPSAPTAFPSVDTDLRSGKANAKDEPGR